MRKIPEVETAKQIMTEAQDWSLWHWLFEKRNVRKAADDANAALAAAEKKVKESWSADLQRAYAELSGSKRRAGRALDPGLVETARIIKEMDDNAEQVRLEAEDIFDDADRRLSASIAREGTFKAIEAWILREKAIRKAEAAARKDQQSDMVSGRG